MDADMLAEKKHQAEIDQLRARANQASADVRRETYEQLRNLMSARDTVSRQLGRPRDATHTTWTEDLLHQTDEALRSFSGRFPHFVKEHG
jgi:hypothetical protein